MDESKARAVQKGDNVRVNYVGTFEDGTIFDSSEGLEPLEFEVGADEVIEGFDLALLGMKLGETRAVDVAPEQGYGHHDQRMVAEVERKLIPDDERLQVGGYLQVTLEDGSDIEVMVTELTETMATLDGNHPLAGKTLRFEIELLAFI